MSLIIDYNNFKKDTTATINKYINSIPAVFVADFLEKMTLELRGIANEQLQKAQSEEVKQDG